jgi:hypothetical protein
MGLRSPIELQNAPEISWNHFRARFSLPKTDCPISRQIHVPEDPMFSLRFIMIALFFLAYTHRAAAQDLDVSTPSPPMATLPPADKTDPPESKSTPWDKTPRPWLYSADPTAPAPGRVLASTSVGYAQTNRGAARPFAADVAHGGGVFSAGAEVGILRQFSVSAEGFLAGQTGAPMAAGAMLGVNAFPLGGRGPVDVSISAGYLRELGGANGVWFRGAVAGNVGRFRFSASALGEHVFDVTRDGVDVLMTAAASVKTTDWLRFGTEYVVQDLEGAWDPKEADGGIRHFLAANASVLLANRVQISAGPALGLSPNSPRVLGRLTAAFVF